jgi:signal transduction histidine kinase
MSLTSRPSRTEFRAPVAGMLTAGSRGILTAGSRGMLTAGSRGAASAPLEAFIDAAHVSEALRLLITNAVEAAAGVSVTCGHAATGGCLVTIDDDGPGMDAATLQRAFDPFSSGREAGRGIGLGLPKAWRLLETNGCRLDVGPRPGRGIRVSVWLPAASPSPGRLTAETGKASPDSQRGDFEAAKESSPTA